MSRGEPPNDPVLLWETWHRWHGQLWLSPLSEIDHLIDSQRRFQSMLADIDVFYSRSDLRMFVDRCRNEARTKILELYVRSTRHIVDAEALDELTPLVLHAAAQIKVSPPNTAQLIEDYPGFVRQTYPEGPEGSLPLHHAAAATGSDQAGRMRPFLNAHPEAIELRDGHGMVPMQIALIHGADFDAMKLLIEAFPPALRLPFLPRPPITDDLAPLLGMLPFHIACVRNYSLDILFQLLVESPDCILGANFPEKYFPERNIRDA